MGYSKKYARFINSTLIEWAPNPLYIGNKTIANAKESIYNELGYYKVIKATIPTDGLAYCAHYELINNQIIQTWILME